MSREVNISVNKSEIEVDVASSFTSGFEQARKDVREYEAAGRIKRFFHRSSQRICV